MKRLLLSASVAILLALSTTACKKDYHCDCKDNGTGDTFESTTYQNTRLVDAQRNCKDRQSFWQNGVKPATECTIL